MYGQCATLPIDINIQGNIPSETTGAYDELKEFEFEDMAKRMKLLEEAKQNILVAQIKQKRDYDRRHAKPLLFNTGLMVLKKDFTFSTFLIVFHVWMYQDG